MKSRKDYFSQLSDLLIKRDKLKKTSEPKKLNKINKKIEAICLLLRYN